jgi:hypothetical protein
MASGVIDIIKQQAKQLPREQKVELLKFLTDTLSTETRRSIPLQFGKYRSSGRPMSTSSDFEIAEWHPNESELNGN